VATGHMLVVPRRHVSDFRDLTPSERDDAWDLASKLSTMFDAKGLNIGINIGEVAGQTVPHAHIHVIPRESGDVDDPRGGVRWVVPHKAAYWSDAS
jgi:diadenosine tetraphosphate (Ap4A) HIT family hydrolase